MVRSAESLQKTSRFYRFFASLTSPLSFLTLAGVTCHHPGQALFCNQCEPVETCLLRSNDGVSTELVLS